MKRITFLLLILFVISFVSCKEKDVTPMPKSEFIYTIESEGVVTFQATSTDATEYEWTLDGTKRTTKSFQYGFGKNQTYQVSLISKNSAGSDVIVKTVSINNLTGSIMLYRKFSTGRNLLEVKVDNSFVGYISGDYYYTSAPNCGNENSVTKKQLNSGNHIYTVRELNTGSSWSGSVNVEGGICHIVGLIK
jgi:PKD repeat protein